MPQLFIFRPGAIFDLGDKLRRKGAVFVRPLRDWRLVLPDRVQQLTQFDRFLVAPTSAAAADVDEPILFQGRQQEPADRAGHSRWRISLKNAVF
ncbi:hypothetical protein ILFOPFJJ_06866 [Ensifer psoraleae]|nr:hypothetical protein [Sinorhizobium psoraleae]